MSLEGPFSQSGSVSRAKKDWLRRGNSEGMRAQERGADDSITAHQLRMCPEIGNHIGRGNHHLSGLAVGRAHAS